MDTGAELSWFPATLLEQMGIERYQRMRFRLATAEIVERWTGVARLHVGSARPHDDVVFAESGDLTLLGARSLEGLNLMIDPVQRRLVDARPMPAAVVAA